ncbi:MAG: hypothetical protein JSS78_08895 [Bacteroidetes bacterium]|nr:hypothetical protein [Bacteroidota bacterium]
MRGAHFHQTLLFDEFPVAATDEIRLGRSAVLIDRRNDKIAYRYYYIMYLLGIKSWDAIIEQLVDEFDLSSAQIVKIITLFLPARIREIINQKPRVKELRKLYPYMVW